MKKVFFLASRTHSTATADRPATPQIEKKNS